MDLWRVKSGLGCLFILKISVTKERSESWEKLFSRLSLRKLILYPWSAKHSFSSDGIHKVDMCLNETKGSLEKIGMGTGIDMWE
jgi:hypothetical protein